MLVLKKYVQKLNDYLKRKNLLLKSIFIVFCLSYLACCRACFNPIDGETYLVHENGSRTKPCYLDGKKLFLKRDRQDGSFFRHFFAGEDDFYVWHLQYQDEDGSMKPILTYKFPKRYGIGAVVQGTGFGIDENKDSINFIYTDEPYEGVKIESSPFADKIAIKKSPTTSFVTHSNKAANDCFCYMEWSN